MEIGLGRCNSMSRRDDNMIPTHCYGLGIGIGGTQGYKMGSGVIWSACLDRWF